jgi:hypothetical protein
MTTKAHNIERPIIIVHKIGDQGALRFVIDLAEMIRPETTIGPGETTVGPGAPGIILSDLLDHIAHAYHQIVPDRDEREIRSDILKVMRDEDRFKEKDPSRSGMEGGLVNRH